jgi:hypothetical protein
MNGDGNPKRVAPFLPKCRASDLLLHVTFPSSYGIGDVGPAAMKWIDRLHAQADTAGERRFLRRFVRRPVVVRVVALSGGYTRVEANDRLRRNHGVVASFSRALVEGLSAQQSDAEFNDLLDKFIESIFEASNT